MGQSNANNGMHRDRHEMAEWRVPEWLRPLHDARAKGLQPKGGWVVVQAGGRVAKWVPAVVVPPGYKPRGDDDMSAFRGLDCEVLIDDETSFRLTQGLAFSILKALPRRLLMLTCGRRNTIITLKGGARYGAN